MLDVSKLEIDRRYCVQLMPGRPRCLMLLLHCKGPGPLVFRDEKTISTRCRSLRWSMSDSPTKKSRKPASRRRPTNLRPQQQRSMSETGLPRLQGLREGSDGENDSRFGGEGSNEAAAAAESE